jgi:hypothetical protein
MLKMSLFCLIRRKDHQKWNKLDVLPEAPVINPKISPPSGGGAAHILKEAHKTIQTINTIKIHHHNPLKRATTTRAV